MPKIITKFVVIITILKESIKTAHKDYSAFQKCLNLCRSHCNIEIKKNVEDLARQTPFSYFDILPIYKQLDEDKEKTLRTINFCVRTGRSLRAYNIVC